MTLENSVIDLSHHNNVASFHMVQAAGIKGVIHKATQGLGFVDPDYQDRKTRALSINLLWGAYHFGTSADAKQQADFFLSKIEPHENTLLALDWESYGPGTMTLQGAAEFVMRIHQVTERWPILYSGQAFLMQQAQVARLNPSWSVLGLCPLWIARYSNKGPQLPDVWKTFALWQYTDARDVPGVGKCDSEKFNSSNFGTLAEFWAGPGGV